MKMFVVIIGFVAFIIAAYFVICLVAAIIYYYRFSTGKISKEEQERLLEIYKREKECEGMKSVGKKSKRCCGSSYPSPLNRYFWP